MNEEKNMNTQSENEKKKEFIAHSKNVKGIEHVLKDHLKETAQLMHSFAPTKELEELFYLAGTLHDMGKYQDGFQKYLEFGKPKTPHAGVSAFTAKKLFNKLISLQFAIQGHHAGMPNNSERIGNLEEWDQQEILTEELIKRFTCDIKEVQSFNSAMQQIYSKDLLSAECLTRFLFSALTDADWLDTERHFQIEKYRTRAATELDHEALINLLEKKFATFNTEGHINNLRTEARVEVAKHFALQPGFFSLQLPTGLGKTLISLYWALLHAKENKLKHIIIVLPYINIIDQTATILKDIFDEDIVLEHHSGVMDEDEEYANEKIDRTNISSKQLACENWQAPIIITTAVQFFESIFSNKPFKCRKNHSIANSVVIFDEIQTLPKEFVEPTIIMLKNISAVARTSFLFCTATMPAFNKREKFDGIENNIQLIEEPMKYFVATKRVNYKLIKKLKPVELEDVVERILKEKTSYLVVVNTKSIAKEFYEKLKETNTLEKYFHLSTSMCPQHRKKTIKEIVAALNTKPKSRIAVVSTQLVEAGVDFDFPCVYRAIAPLDSVIQAAGRCNRNGNLKKGNVVLFDLPNHLMPDKTYAACTSFAKGIIQDDPEILHDAKSFERYYEQVLEFFVDKDLYKITDERKAFNFKTINEQYKVIPNKTTMLFIPGYSTESNSLLEELEKFFDIHGFILKEHYRKIQQYSIQVYPDFLKKYGSQIETHKSGLKIWLGNYNPEIGIAPEDVETIF